MSRTAWIGALPAFVQRWLPRRLRQPAALPPRLWRWVLAQQPFLSALTPPEQQRLQLLCRHFLAEKEFFGANGLHISDAMALTIAAQACLPLLHIAAVQASRRHHELAALDWYADFVGIVVQPGAALAQREVTDDNGVVHRYRELLAGEAMDRGPVMLSWQDVSAASADGSNVVIHEFMHKIDMHGMSAGQAPDGAPALPPGFLGTLSAAQAREHWRAVMQASYDRFCEALKLAERFGAPSPWLNDYAATDPAEFFAVTCEAYFVDRARFASEFPDLMPLYDGFFQAKRPLSA
ncbi:zinc-dependent peptidase [Hydrogenophaga sp.]|uniref:M90 family metallopeptidase n=1 Tax=Hydrogenophaga sp. TaxID=1904254 RepID=UPI0019B7B306|nr:zinc-dependent peptidase [Hydrogenophaga sp.]MBD3893981.1 zinc-dependent peptidase [Hydrogenophaga sp.]